MQQPERVGQSSKIYEWLAEREQRAVDAGSLNWTPEAGSWDGDPVRLARFRRREPVDIWAVGLPSWAFDGSAPSAWMRRVVVYPNGDLVFRDDVPLWVVENCGAFSLLGAR